MHNELPVHLWNIDRIDAFNLSYLVSDSFYRVLSRIYLVDVQSTWYGCEKCRWKYTPSRHASKATVTRS
jgi:hypothetical protein